MNTQKHTPWIARPYGDDDGLWAVTNTTGRLVFLGRYEAEARLIAAAADLLASERENLTVLANLLAYLRKHEATLPPLSTSSLEVRIEKTRAAIRKAEGGAS